MDQTVLKTTGLTKKYKGELGQKDFLALENLNLEIKQGEVFGFLGPNGAGKSTTIKLLARLLHPTRGDIQIFGESNKYPKAMNRVGYMPEQPSLYGYLTGREFLQYMARLYGLRKSQSQKAIETLMQIVGLPQKKDHAIRGYSRGMVQRLALAQALINDPDLLILDEPMANLDPVGRKDFRDLILELKNKGKTIFFSSHILNDAEMIADRVGILNQGHLVKISAMQDLINQDVSVEITFHTNATTLEGSQLSNHIYAQQGETYMIRIPQNDTQKTIESLSQAQVEILAVIPQRITLEDIFMKEIGGNTK